MTNKNFSIFLFFSICTLFTTAIFSQNVDYAPNELLIKWTANSTANQQATVRSTARATALRSFPNLDIELWQVEGDHLNLLELINKYSKHPAIEFVEPNYFYYGSDIIPNDPRFDEQWGMVNTGQIGSVTDADIKASKAWEVQRESPSVKVAIIDTGIDWDHADLIDNIWQNKGEDADGDGQVLVYLNNEWVFDPDDENGIDDDGNGYIDDFIGWDFANDDNDPSDDHFHGTHVAGIVGAKGHNGIGIAGVTWTVQMAALKFLGANNLGTTANAIAAIDYAIAMGMDLSNSSWGGPRYSSALYTAIQNGASQNHIVIAAAGNNGNDTDTRPEYPASFNLGNIISVANTTQNDELAATSNYGTSSVDIAAPGTRILSCFPNDTYGVISGTSMAAPHVTGACALLLEKQPNTSYTILKNQLLNTVDALPDLNDKIQSRGRLNIRQLLGGEVSISTLPCATKDSLALVDLYNATDGVNWTKKWDLNQPMTTWSGVSINDKGCVVSLFLTNNELTGMLPTTMGDMTSLQQIYLDDNQLTGPIPIEMNRLFDLRRLIMGNNQLTGNIPPGIGSLTNLRLLQLYNNQLTGSIPTGIGNLRKLQSLQLNKNQLTGTIPSELSHLKSLIELILTANQLTGTIPKELGNLSNLQRLILSSNQLTGTIPDELGKLDNLEKLILSNNQLTGTIPPVIGDLINLESLRLDNNGLTGVLPTALGALVNLGEIWMQDNALSGCFPQSFAQFCAIQADFYGNIALPQNGDFGAFCERRTGICPCTRQTDSLTLVTLYTATQGNNWTTTWNLNTPITTWQGISTNTNGCVTAINLPANQLIGPIPEEIAHLTDLQTIHLQNNQLTGCFSPILADLCSIDYNFSNNSNLPSNGDFSAFCMAESGSCLTCNRTVDSLALVALYNATNGSNWTTPWDLSTVMDHWQGVLLTSSGCVRSIYLSDNGLSGTIPNAIGDLNNLQHLHLANNQLTGNIPTTIGHLTNLVELVLYQNQLTGNIPTNIGQLDKLRQVLLSDNQLTGNIPTAIGNLSNLRQLWLHKNQLTGTIPTSIVNLRKLQQFRLSENQLTGSIPIEIGALVNLKELSFSDNQLTGNIPNSISHLTNLQRFYLNSNQLTGSIPTNIGRLHRLQRLELNSNQLTGSIPSEIGNLSNLQSIRIYDNQLTGSIPSELARLSNLEQIFAYTNQLSGCFPQNFTTFCNTIFYGFGNNPNLPNGGNMETFCADNSGSCSDQNLVWPGDYNNDGRVNNSDVLYWGLAKDRQGPARPNASSNWVAQSSPNWTNTTNTINGKHQDGDGNGVVNSQDLSVIYANYGQVHGSALLAATATNGVTYRLAPKGFQGETTFTYDIFVELDDEPITTHGLAFTVYLNELSITSADIDVTNSSLVPDEHRAIFDSATNTIEVALTRTDKTDQLCDGPIATLSVTMSNIEVGDPIQIDISQGNRVMADGDFKAIASTSLFDNYTELTASNLNLLPIVYATHEECDQLGTARVAVAGGTPPYAYQWSNGANTATTSNLVAGTYMVTITDANNLTTNYTILIKKQFTPVYDENGDLVNCNIPAACASNLNFSNTIPTGVHQAGNTITANGTVSSTSSVTFQAGESITLTAGFTAQAGASFLAHIEGCTANTFEGNQITNRLRKTSALPNTHSEEQITMQIFPNPIQQQAKITYQLPSASSVQLLISDLQGRSVRILLDHVFHEKGQQAFTFWADDLSKGIYLVSLKTDYGMKTEKMVVME